jgi:lysyl-tRNA synthetase class 2
MMELVEDLVCTVAERVLGTLVVEQDDGRVIDMSRPWRRARYDDLVREAIGEDWFELDSAAKRERAQEYNVSVEGLENEVDVTNQVFEKLVESHLLNPTFVLELPAQLVPLAKYVPGDTAHVDVFEMIMGGQEIAPGYSEQNDPILQRRRFEQQAAIRKEGDEDFEVSQSLDEDFLMAMEHGILFPHMRPLAADEGLKNPEEEPETV